jgi:uncharacterized protein (DUF952 family)
MRVYKVLSSDDRRVASLSQGWHGNRDDVRDGYVHLATHAQLTKVLERFFAGREDLFLAAFDADRLGPGLRWEASASGTLYPHFYGPIDLSAAIRTTPLEIDPRTRVHRLPEEF